jgi:hypothetical protein
MQSEGLRLNGPKGRLEQRNNKLNKAELQTGWQKKRLKLLWQNLEIRTGVVPGSDARIVAVRAMLVAVADNQCCLAGIAVQGNVVSDCRGAKRRHIYQRSAE